MAKSKGILKGKVKRLLQSDEDMGQITEPAVQCCVSAMEAFVRDIGMRLRKHAEEQGVAILTPVDLKSCVLKSDDLAFLHDKVAAIDECDAKYSKAPRASRKRKVVSDKEPKDSKSAPKTQPPRKKKATARTPMDARPSPTNVSPTETPSAPQSALRTRPSTIAIAEDDNYDDSDSE